MGECIIGRPILPKNVGEIVKSLSEGDNVKENVLAGIYFTKEFQAKLKESNIELDANNDLVKTTDKNSVKKLLREDYIRRKKDIKTTATKEIGESIFGFNNGKAFSEAQIYTATIINRLHRENQLKPEAQRLSKEAIIKLARKRINDYFINEVVNNALNRISGNSTRAKVVIDLTNLLNDYNETIEVYENLAKKLNQDKKQYNRLSLEYKRKFARAKASSKNKESVAEDIKKIETEKEKLYSLLQEITKQEENIKPIKEKIYGTSEIIGLKSSLFAAAHNFIEKYGNHTENNYSNLVSNINNNNGKEWIERVFLHPNLTNIAREYKSVLKSEQTFVDSSIDIDEDTTTIQDANAESDIHDTGWDKEFKSFVKAVDGNIRAYFNSLPKLAAYSEDGINYIADRNNELGVELPDDGAALLAYAILNLNYNSKEAFLKSVEEAAKIPQLYSLAIFAKDLRANSNFLNQAFSELRKPAIKKAIVNVTDKYLRFVQTNVGIDPIFAVASTIVNDFKLTHLNAISSDDLNNLEEAIKNINKLGVVSSNTSAKYFAVKDTFIKAEDLIRSILNRYCPSISYESISNVLNDSSKALSQTYIEILNTLKDFIEAANNTEEKLIAARNTYNAKYKKYAEEIEVYDGRIGKKPVKPVFYISDNDYSEIWKMATILGETIAKRNVVKTRLNTANAAGNMSSDVIANSRITNLLRTIGEYTQQGKDDIVYEKLEILRKEVESQPYYDYSQIFYGVPGTSIEGLFIKEENGETKVNPKAKDVLSFYLFDGAINRASTSSSLYGNMYKGDYFLCMMSAFVNNKESQNAEIQRNSEVPNRAGYFLRVPSDASKNFIAYYQKLSIAGLEYANEESLQQYIENYKSILEQRLLNGEKIDKHQYPKLVLDSEIKDYKFGEETNTANRLTADEVLEIIEKGKLNNKRIIFKQINTKLLSKDSNEVSFVLYYGEGDGRIELIGTAKRFKNPDKDSYQYNEFKIDKIVSKYKVLPRQLFIDVKDKLRDKAIKENKVSIDISKDHPIFKSLVNNVLQEFNLFVSQLNVVFDKNGNLVEDITGLFDFMHHNKGKLTDGKVLLGNAFKFLKLGEIGDFNADVEIKKALSLYGADNTNLIQSKGGKLTLNSNDKSYITRDNDGKLKFVNSNEIQELIEDVVSKWIKNYFNKVLNYASQFDSVNDGRYTQEQIKECLINTYLTNMMFDDILEGNAKFYKNAQTLLKRAKENQMGGVAYSNIDEYADNQNTLYDIAEAILVNGKEVLSPDSLNGLQETPIKPRNGFRAVTIYNTNEASKNAENIYKDVYDNLIKKGINEKVADKIARNIAEPFGLPKENGEVVKTCINDAQSFITIEEYIRRAESNGTLPQVADTINKLLDPNFPLSQIKPDDLAKIQVQKNVYYDIAYDTKTGLPYPRQIKNAEFVLIPRLIKGTKLETLYDIMKRNDIGQVNTIETSKAANKTVFEFFLKDDSTKINENFEDDIKAHQDLIEIYYYKNLYKQQDVHEHSKDVKNKVGIQMLKKMIDNYHTASPEVQQKLDKLIENYVYNIQESYNELIQDLGWKVVDGKLVNEENPNAPLDYSEFYDRLKEESARLGLDSNFIDYVTLDESGQPIMPNFMNLVSTKFETILQSIFNNYITRQELPGWHGVQVTNVGIDDDLHYHPTVMNEDGTVKHEGYIEVLLPRWSRLLPKYKPTPKLNSETQEQYNERIEKERQEFDKKLLDKLQKEGLTIQLGYRIPTEGKQSISVIKVVGFLDDSQGSTIVLPAEWVAQTGADFDVDSVYGMCHEIYIDKYGNIRKFKLDVDESEAGIQRRYVNYIKNRVKTSKRTRLRTKDFKNAFEVAKEKLSLDSPLNVDAQRYNELKKNNAKLRRQFPKTINKEIDTIIKNNTTSKIDDVITNNDIIKVVNTYKEQEQNQDIIKLYDEYISSIEQINELISAHRDYISDVVVNKAQLESIEQIAKDCHLMSYEEFKKLPLLLQNDKRARNNEIIDGFAFVLAHNDSHEENYSRSNFDDMTDSNAEINKALINKDTVRSPYDPIDQIENFNNAAAGRQLKGLSVTYDNFLSLTNKGRATVLKDYQVTVFYDGNPFVDEEVASSVYGGTKTEKGFAVVHNKYGWSESNRNVVGKLLTAYSSQTSAQTFDIIKEGSIPNIDTYTFPIFKNLINMGIDYYTAILFMRQPGITEIVNANTESNSIFTDKTSNPIDVAIKRYAKKIFGEKVNDFTPINEVLSLLGKEFINEYENATLTLNVKELQTQINTNEPKEQILTILKFRKLLKFNNLLDKTVKASNPDKFGAKSTINETRKVAKDVQELRNNFEENVLFVKDENGRNIPFIEGLYPLNTNGKIDEFKSFYPYMAAFMKYSTLQSIDINKDIYLLENDSFDSIWNRILNDLQINDKKEINKQFRKYIVNYAFNQLDILRYPITINKDGFIGYDLSRIDTKNNLEEIADLERLRLYGYEYEEYEDFELKDYANPTQEEIDKFNKLTPVQKIIYVKKHISDAALFDLLSVNIYDGENAQKQGKHPVIVFDDQTIDKESAFNLFKETFYNKHSFAKLAAIDLVKYAFVVEGYNFASGNVSKVIPNSIIRNRIEDYGLNLIQSVWQEFSKIVPTLNNMDNYDTFLDKFIRSHSQIAKKVHIPRSANLEEKNAVATLGNIWDSSFESTANDFARIKITPSNSKLLVHLGILKEVEHFRLWDYTTEEEAKKVSEIEDEKLKKEFIKFLEDKYHQHKFDYTGLKYINVSKYNASEKRHISKLFKIVQGKSGVIYLIPMNKLEANETAEYSINNFNNLYEREGSYLGFIQYVDEQVKTISDYTFDENNVPKRKTNSDIFENPNALKSLLDSPNSDLQAGVKKLYNGIIDFFTNNDGLKIDYVQTNNNASLSKIKFNINSLQAIEVNGETKYITISRLNANRFKRIFNDSLFKDLNINDLFNSNWSINENILASNTAIYKLINKLSISERKAFKEAALLVKQFPNMSYGGIKLYVVSEPTIPNVDIEYESAYETIDFSPVGEASTITAKEILAQRVYNALKDGSKVNELAAERYLRPLSMRGVNPKSSRSIADNLISIYKSGLYYYKEKSRAILSDIEEFECSNGQKYKITDIALYNYLLESNNEEDLNKLIKLLLDAFSFGREINDVFDLNIEGEDLEVKHSVEELKRTISKIKDNSIIKAASDLLINKIYAPKLSTNPLVKAGLISVTESFNDIGFTDLHISNITEIGNKEIQIMLKELYSKLEVAKQTIDSKVREFRRRHDEIMSKEGSFNRDNIIDENGILIRKHTNNFLKDKDALYEKIQKAEKEHGKFSIEYEFAVLEKLEWYAKNVEQEYDQNYYIEYNANLRQVLETAPQQYIKYKALVAELSNLIDNFSILTNEDRRRIIEINRIIDNMSRVDSISEATTDREQQLEEHNKSSLGRFIKRRREINKKYFEYVEDENFNETLKRHLKTIENYDRNNNYQDLDVKLQDADYREAFEWIKLNSFYRINDEVAAKINAAFNKLKANDGARPNRTTNRNNAIINDILNAAKDDPDRKVVDEYGIFHPERLTEDEIREIKEITEAIYIGDSSPTGGAPDSKLENDSYGTLIKDIPNDLPVYKKEVYDAISTNKKYELDPEEQQKLETELNELNSRRNNLTEVEKVRRSEIYRLLNPKARAEEAKSMIIAKINNLIKLGINRNTGKLSTELLFNALTLEQKRELASLYEELAEFDSIDGKERSSKLYKIKGKNLYVGLKPNKEAFQEELTYYRNHLANSNDGALWLRIFTENRTLDGNELRPNLDIYGYFFISDSKGYAANKEQSEILIDKEKTEAKNFIRENITYEAIEYYYVAMNKAIADGKFEKWYELNHYYDPFEHKIKPLKIWTEMRIKPTSQYANEGNYVQKDATLSRKIREGYENKSPNYNKNLRKKYTQYNPITGQYKNDKYSSLSNKELEIVKLLEETISEYAKSNEAQLFFAKGYIPRLRKPEDIDAKYVTKQMLGVVGIEAANINSEWKSKIDYSTDKEADFNMAKLLQGKGSREKENYKNHSEFETQEEYDAIEQLNEEIKERNKKIDEENAKIDKELFEKDILSVFETFISKSIVYNVKNESKNLAYLVQEDLRRKKGYKHSSFTGNLIKDDKISTETRTEYIREDFTDTIKLFENWFRRYFYDEHKKGNKLSTLASVLQNITSAKYMQFNVTGGAANVGTGFANILGEGFAKDYFDNADLAQATLEYLKSLPAILSSMYSDTSSNLTVALIKRFNVVNYEEMLERRNNETVNEYIQRVRDWTYGLQAGGEHFMQNTALLAMMLSHRVITENGKTEIYTYSRFINTIESRVLEEMLRNNPEVAIRYNAYLRKIKSDAKLRDKYDRLKGNYVVDFIKEYTRESQNDEFLNNYIKEKDKAIKEAKEKFNTYPKLIDQFELSQSGTAVLKSDSKVTDEMLGKFSVKVINVNEKIHGNYSKLGAARIEAEWWGGLVMQYHKHLYPGIMKRWRLNGYFNELRESFEKGSYISLGQFLGTEFKDIAKRIKDNKEDQDSLLMIASIQEVFKALVDTVVNFKLNWKLLPEWEKNNIRRTYGDLCGIAGSISLAIAIHMAADDDDIKNSNLLSSFIYISDRLFAESRMYTPLGLYSEASTLWSSPIAARNSIGDLLKLINITGNILFDEDFNPLYTTGLYKGEHKAMVLLKNNIPIYRNIHRLQNMSRNNSYYRINDNARNIKFARNVADIIVPD